LQKFGWGWDVAALSENGFDDDCGGLGGRGLLCEKQLELVKRV